MLQNALLLGGKKALKCPCDYSILVRYPVLSYHYSLWDSRYWTTSAYFQKNSKWASSSISDYACLVEVFNSPPIDCDLYLYDVYKISKSPERQQSLFFFFFFNLAVESLWNENVVHWDILWSGTQPSLWMTQTPEGRLRAGPFPRLGRTDILQSLLFSMKIRFQLTQNHKVHFQGW